MRTIGTVHKHDRYCIPCTWFNQTTRLRDNSVVIHIVNISMLFLYLRDWTLAWGLPSSSPRLPSQNNRKTENNQHSTCSSTPHDTMSELLADLLIIVLFGTQASFTHPGVILPAKESLGDIELKSIVRRSQRNKAERWDGLPCGPCVPGHSS